MKFQAIVDASRMSEAMELGGKRIEPGDYLVCGDGPEFLVLEAAVFEAIFRPVNGAAHKSAREPKEAAEEPGRKRGEIGRLILQSLKEGPKIVSAVNHWMRSHGHPDQSTKATGLALNYQARKGHCVLGKDRQWRLKG